MNALTWLELQDATAIRSPNRLSSQHRRTVDAGHGQRKCQGAQASGKVDAVHRVHVMGSCGVQREPGSVSVHIGQEEVRWFENRDLPPGRTDPAFVGSVNTLGLA